MTASPSDRMLAAAEIAEALAAKSQGVDAVCLYGSVARGDEKSDSDIDLLVVGDGRVLSGRLVRALVPNRLQSLRPALTFYSWRDLDILLSARSSFAAHLAHEGRILFDREGTLAQTLAVHADEPVAVENELNYQLRRLRALKDTSQFNGNFLFCFAHLYVIGKAVVMLRLAAEGHADYNKDRAFESFARRHPELRREVEQVIELKPFYLRVARRQDARLPYSYRDAESRVRGLISAVRQLGQTR